MKKILFIATGGTIASKKTENGLTPQITPEELLSYIPEVEGLCEITAVNPFNLDSSNVVPENWSTLVKVVKEHYEDYDGFVIAHGTDTMAYTAAALSYMIQNSEKPIVITGAQRPINLDITDAKTNLSDSFYYACDDASPGCTDCVRRKSHRGNAREEGADEELQCLFQHRFPVPCGNTGPQDSAVSADAAV